MGFLLNPGSLLGGVTSLVTGIKDDDQRRAIIASIASAAYSSWISALWRAGQRSLWGFGPALKDAATSAYMAFHATEKKGFALIVPKELLDPANLNRFQVEEVSK
jgi:hypothetical protein